jgi:hypothetical protein
MLDDPYSSSKTIRIPVRFADGKWEFFFGGDIPAEEGAFGELLIAASRLKKGQFLDALIKDQVEPALQNGTELLFQVEVKPEARTTLPPRLWDLLLPIGGKDDIIADNQLLRYTPGVSRVVKATLEAEPGAKAPLDQLCFVMRGAAIRGVTGAKVRLPEPLGSEKLMSLNHAMTFLSETFETHRISHTGNIYRSVFYQEGPGRWRPLQCLRDARSAAKEDEIAYGLWQRFLARHKAK